MLTKGRESASRFAELLALELRIVAVSIKVLSPPSGAPGVSSSEVPFSGSRPLINILSILRRVEDECPTPSRLLERFRCFHVYFCGF